MLKKSFELNPWDMVSNVKQYSAWYSALHTAAGFKEVYIDNESMKFSGGVLIGVFKVNARVWCIESGIAREVTLLADTGAIYTVLPRSLLEELGVKPIGKRRFRLADGRVVEREIGLIGIEIGGRAVHTIAVFGDEGTHLLGVVTLGELGLQVDPVSGELKPLELLLMVLVPEAYNLNRCCAT
ncbi:MAG: aspartyl protease family protein [Sulfolobales archaeon]